MIKKNQRFGNWIVINPEKEYFKSKTGKTKYAKVLCFDEEYNELQYVKIESLVYKKSTGCKKRSVDNYTKIRNERKWSTRYKHQELPKYVYMFNPKNMKSKKTYRVAKKYGNSYITIGYFNTQQEAEKIAFKID